MAEQGSGGNVIAALCSVFIPGLGQLVQGRLMPAIVFFVVCMVGYAMWCQIYTDVDGVYSIDPRICPAAKRLAFIPYGDMLELGLS